MYGYKLRVKMAQENIYGHIKEEIGSNILMNLLNTIVQKQIKLSLNQVSFRYI